MNTRRTRHRSRSGAEHACLHCAKRLRGQKGLALHMLDQHPDQPLPAELSELLDRRYPAQARRVAQ